MESENVVIVSMLVVRMLRMLFIVEVLIWVVMFLGSYGCSRVLSKVVLMLISV